MSVRIVSDSAANLFAMDGVDYVTVPLKIIAGRREYVDAPGLDVQQMIQELAAYGGRSGSSCPNAQEWAQAFAGADTVYALTITGALSGSCACAQQARKELLRLHPETHIFVLDSLSAGPQMQLILEKLREWVLEGKSFEDIRVELLRYRQRTRLLFALRSLHNLANNGRVSPAAAKIAGLLGIRLVGTASAQGTLELLHKCRSDEAVFKKLIDEMAACGFQGGRVCVAHCLAEEQAQAFAQALRRRFGPCEVNIVPCAGLCAFYAERGGLMIGYECAR